MANSKGGGKPSSGSGAQAAVAALLRRNRLLSVLDDEEMAAFVALGRIEQHGAESVIFSKGDPGDRLYAIIRGQVAISTTSEDGKMMLLNILDPGDVLGEIALIDARERTASATALVATELFRIDRPEFIDFIEQRPKLATRLMIVLCERLRWVSENIEDTVFLDVPRRLAKRLLLLSSLYGKASSQGIRIAQELSQEDIANMLGVTREIINRTLNGLKKRGLISYTKGFIVITDAEALRELAG